MTNDKLNVTYITDIIGDFTKTILKEEGNNAVFVKVRLGFPDEMQVPDVFHNFLITNNSGRCIFEYINYNCGIPNNAEFDLVALDFDNEITTFPNLNDNLVEANYLNIEEITILEKPHNFEVNTSEKYTLDFIDGKVFISIIWK